MNCTEHGEWVLAGVILGANKVSVHSDSTSSMAVNAISKAIGAACFAVTTSHNRTPMVANDTFMR